MAAVESLGIHTPAALEYFIAEGLLSQTSGPDDYNWDTYVTGGDDGEFEEEVLVTKNAVAWSQGRFIRNVYRFHLDGEDVVQALLTNFPCGSRLSSGQDALVKPGIRQDASPAKSPSLSKFFKPTAEDDHKPVTSESTSRALVVILKSKLHIYFVEGASHIVDLPFEVERAFPAPHGLVLQTKSSRPSTSLLSPTLPFAPPNSFGSSQILNSSITVPSPAPVKISYAAQSAQPNWLSDNPRLEKLFRDVTRDSKQANDEEFANFYSLTGPMTDFGVVTYSIPRHRPRQSGKSYAPLTVDFEPLEPAEEVIYVSPHCEMSSGRSHANMLMLVVTVNPDLGILTLWHAWYIEEKSLRSFMKQRADHKAAKVRRRSSFFSANIGTGAATPTVRQREGTRESFAAAGSTRTHHEPVSSHPSAPVSRNPTKQEEADAMASNMDPDYQPSGSQAPGRDNRRISSMNADLRAAHTAGSTGVGTAAGRRHTSFGGATDRRSFGHRKSRGSTPGSAFSYDIDASDDLMEMDSSGDFSGDETAEKILKQIRATLETSGIENTFGSAGEGFKRELVVRKIHSFPLGTNTAVTASAASQILSCKVITLPTSPYQPDADDGSLNVYLHDRRTQELQCIELDIRFLRVWPELQDTMAVAIPLFRSQVLIGRFEDIQKLQDGQLKAILFGRSSIVFHLSPNLHCPLPEQPPYRSVNYYDMFSVFGDGELDQRISPTLPVPDRGFTFARGGTQARFDEIPEDRISHRRRLQIRPQDSFVDKVLEVCEAALPRQQSQAVRSIWCMAQAWLCKHHGYAAVTSSSPEFISLVATIFTFAIGFLDNKIHTSLNMSKLDTRGGQPTTTDATKWQVQQHEAEIYLRPAWARLSSRNPAPVSGNFKDGNEGKDQLLILAAALANELVDSTVPQSWRTEIFSASTMAVARLMLALHIFSEEQKLCTVSGFGRSSYLGPVISQFGSWLGLSRWDHTEGKYYGIESIGNERWMYVKASPGKPPQLSIMDEPTGVFEWFENCIKYGLPERYPSLLSVAQMNADHFITGKRGQQIENLTPRICALSSLLERTNGLSTGAIDTVEQMSKLKISPSMLETFPESIASPLREATSACERNPPATWSEELLRLIHRDELLITTGVGRSEGGISQTHSVTAPRDTQAICNAVENTPGSLRTKEANRHEVSQLIFCEDRRLVEATSLMHFSSTQVADCPKQPDWTEAFHFEQQRRLMQWVTMRMIALPPGDGMIHLDSQTPLLTEKYPLPGFSSSCLMQPMGHTLTTDRSWLTEEKVNWAYFHAGVASGLRISRATKGIDTSWIAFNKPAELTNRHAGLLLALGLGGHLRHVAKWLSFKYLTPKHPMTSIGLLLGLSASYIGTMDGLVTRMLSVHITRMLPSGAAELNVSSTTQTAGLMGIGLLYHNTQHRRMSEIMLSEIGHMDIEDPDSGPDMLRDESYRLAAGFALGLINLGKGENLRGLQGLQLHERLLAVAIGPRPVSAVHVFDRAAAGAVIAIALVYMKTGNKAVASKIDIPDTEAQFDHVRPDILLLRAMAKHVILWDSIVAGQPGSPGWIEQNLPACYKSRSKRVMDHMIANRTIASAHVPLFNVYTGLAWALSLKYAGSGDTAARDEILGLLKFFSGISDGTDAYYYDGKLGRLALRRCMDVLALCAATVMAGTGDIPTFRYLRRMHGRTDADTPYGSHLASHMAIGTLFLAGGTATLGTSDLAIAMLICAFYPLFPTDVQDNNVHLQAFRHLWVLAAEGRCMVVEDIDTQRPIHMPIKVTMKNGTLRTVRSPCLLPELETIATLQTDDPAYWRVTLDFVQNPAHLASFRHDQRFYVRKCPAAEAHSSVYSAALAALNSSAYAQAKDQRLWQSLFDLPAFKDVDPAEIELVLPSDVHGSSSAHLDGQGTSVGDRLALTKATESTNRDQLWNLRVLFTWAQRAADDGNGKLSWLRREDIETLKAKVEERMRGME